MLDRIAKVDPLLKSYATVMGEQALATARAAEREIRAGRYRGPLHGVPIAVKDLCYTKGVRTMGGTRGAERISFPTVDATVVSRLREAGAVLLGKLNLSEGATAGLQPGTRRATQSVEPRSMAGHVIERVRCRDGGRSVLRGHRHRHRRLDSQPVVGQRRGGSQADVRSCESLRRAGDGRVARSRRADGADASQTRPSCSMRSRDTIRMIRRRSSAAGPQAFKDLDRRIRGMRIGLDRDYALKGIDSGQAAAIEAALKVLTGLGAPIVDVRMPDLSGVLEMWSAICGFGNRGRSRGDLSVARERVRSLYARVPGDGRAGHSAAGGGCARAPRGVHGAVQRRARISRCDGRSGWRRSGMADHTRATGGLAARVSQGVVRRGASQQRVHDADGSGRRAGDLPAVRLFRGRAAVQHSVQRATAQRADVVPDRACIRTGDRVAHASPERDHSVTLLKVFHEALSCNRNRRRSYCHTGI